MEESILRDIELGELTDRKGTFYQLYIEGENKVEVEVVVDSPFKLEKLTFVDCDSDEMCMDIPTEQYDRFEKALHERLEYEIEELHNLPPYMMFFCDYGKTSLEIGRAEV